MPERPEPTATMDDVSPEVKEFINKANRNISEREKQRYYRNTGRDQYGRLWGEKPLESED